jgi:hypothetical protein
MIVYIYNLPKNTPIGIKSKGKEVEAIISNNDARFLGISKQ